jgi:hypothetical protein
MVGRQDATADGVEPRWRINGTSMALIWQLLSQAGVLDEDERGPFDRPGPTTDDGEDQDRLLTERFTRWQAEQRGRVEAADPATLRIPAVKFESNSDWEVFPAEAARINATLASVTDEQAAAAVAAEMEADATEGVSTAWGETPEHDLRYSRIGSRGIASWPPGTAASA